MASGVDIIARGMAASAKGSLQNKADLVNGKVPSEQLPSYVDDVIEGYYYNNKFYLEETHVTEIVPESGKIYVDLTSNKTYRWSGSTYIQIGGAGVEIQYIELTGWDETAGWHTGGTLTDAQAAVLVVNEMNYIWMNGMHRLDFRYKDSANNLATYSASDGPKTHVIEITLSDKTWRYQHVVLQEKMIAGSGISIGSDGKTINADVRTYKPFPSSWPHTYGTTITSFCAAVNASYQSGEVKVGDAFLGNINSPAFFSGAYVEGYGSLGSAEVSVQIMTPFGQDCVQLLTVTSSNNAPYHWEYTYVDGALTEGWRSWTDIRKLNSSSTSNELKYLSLNGTEYKLPSIDWTNISGYDATKTQTLSHDSNGNVIWIDIS